MNRLRLPAILFLSTAALSIAPLALSQQPATPAAPSAPPQSAPLQSASPQSTSPQSPTQPASPATPPQSEGFSAAPITSNSSQVPTFKATTFLVVVDVVVTAKNGAPVHGLRESDFRIFENGQPQAIKSFEERKNDMLPVITPSQGLPEGAATNAGQNIPSTALSVILFDALNTASADQSFARDQVKKVIASLPPGSRIAIFTLRGSLHMLQGFTTDTALLAQAMSKDKSVLSGPWFNDPDTVLMSSGGDPAAGMGGGGVAGASTSSGAGDILSGNGSPVDSMGGPGTFLGSTAARDEVGLTSKLRTARTFAALQAIAKYLSALPGRKNLFWLSGVFPFDIMPDTSGTSATPDPFRGISTYGEAMYQLAAQMEAGHIAVYPIDVRGLTANMFNAAGSAHPSASNLGDMSVAELSQDEVMDNIAHQTGGRAVYNNNDIQGEIIESLNQGANYYSIAYSPTNRDWNGKMRKIDVHSDLKNVSFYYRRGYLAIDPSKASTAISSDSIPRFAVAMLHGAPERADIVMTVKTSPTGKYVEEKDRPKPALIDRNAPPTAAAVAPPVFNVDLKGTTEYYSIDCSVDAKTVKFTEGKDGKFTPQLALTFIAYDADGKLLNAQIGAFALPLTAAQHQAVLERGLTINNRMELPLGRVYLRVGVHDLSNDKVGSMEIPLLVTRSTQSAHK